MQTEFLDRVAVVTGASSGIGRATALKLVEQGARVVVFSRSAEKLEAIVRQNPGRMMAIAGDVADPMALSNLFERARKQFGDCELLVNSAGMAEPRRVETTSVAQWDEMFAVNVRGSFLAIREALPQMTARGRGNIVNISSISGVPGPEKFPGFAAYCASKGAIISMTEAMAVEFRVHNIRVNCVSPGSVDTPMWASLSGGAPASMTPQEVADTVLFLLSDRSRPMNGQNLHVYSS